jgi:hypothetical protein
MGDVDILWSEFLETNNYGCTAIDVINRDTRMVNSNDLKLDEELLPETDACQKQIKFNIKHKSPKCGDLFISTQTKIVHLNQKIPLKDIFWQLPITNYLDWVNGIVKKQMKFNSNTKEELDLIGTNLTGVKYWNEHIITSIDEPEGRVKFKDIRKITVGLSRKDIVSYRCKPKSAFYNCFVLIIRLNIDDVFKEFHVKIFNTGKVEIPGIKNDRLLGLVMDEIINILSVYYTDTLKFNDYVETVLINSNFNCGFNIDRQRLYDILRSKYKIQAMFDPCSYPGIQCKFYYDTKEAENNGQQLSENYKSKNFDKSIYVISMMIFRTGGVLIVGRCTELILQHVYEFVKRILGENFSDIEQGINNYQPKPIKKNRKRKTILVNLD